MQIKCNARNKCI